MIKRITAFHRFDNYRMLYDYDVIVKTIVILGGLAFILLVILSIMEKAGLVFEREPHIIILKEAVQK